MEALFRNLLEITVFSSVLIIVVLALRMIFAGKLNIKIISLLWLLVILRLILPITIESPVHIGGIIDNKVIKPTESQVFENASVMDEKPDFGQEIQPLLNTEIKEQSAEISEWYNFESNSEKSNVVQEIKSYFASINLFEILFGVWLTGAMTMLIFNTIWIIKFNSKVKSSKFLSDKSVAQKVYVDCHKLGIGKNVAVYECDYIDSPITCGLFRPKILLPACLVDSIGQEKAELIIFHELIHIKNYDIFKNYLWLAAKIVHWFNPIVYFGYSRYLEDIELACDDVVLNKHSKQEILAYSQGLLDVIKLSQGDIKLPFAMSFCKDKTKIRKRVETMLKPEKKLRFVGAISLALAVIMIFGCFTTACQPKEEVAEVDAVIEQTSEKIEDEEISETEVTSYIKPEVKTEKYKEVFENESGDIIVNVDAEVKLPTINKIPYAKAEHVGYSQKQLEKIIEAFFGNQDYYDLSKWTKDDYQKQIDYYNKQAESLESEMASETRITDLDELRKFADKEIKKLKEKQDDAPQEKPIIKVDGENFVDKEFFVCDMYKGEVGKSDNIGSMEFFNSQISKDFACSIDFQGRYEPTNKYPVSERDDFDITKLKEYAVAKAFMEQTGIKNIIFGDVFRMDNTTNQGRERKIIKFTFERKVGQGTVDYSLDAVFGPYDDYDNPIWFEKIELWVEDDEVVRFYWKNPMEITEIIDDDVKINVSYEQAIKIVEEYIIEHNYNKMFMGNADEIEFIIGNIDFELVRMHDRDGNYFIVPAWKFYTENLKMKASKQAIDMETFGVGYEVGDYVGRDIISSSDAFMVINALDGSIIQTYVEQKG